MLLDPHQLASQWGPILGLTAVVLAGGALGGTLGAGAAGLPLPMGLRVGLTLAQPGELSLVLVGVGSAAGILWPSSLAVVVGVTFLTAILGPVCFGRGEAWAARLDANLPHRLKARLASIQGWTGALTRRGHGSPSRALASSMFYLVLDAVCFNALLLGAAQARHHPLVTRHPEAALALMGGTLAGLTVLGWVLFRRAGQLAILLAPPPRQGAIRAALLVVVGAPTFAMVQPILPKGPALALMTGVMVALMILFRGHARRFPQLGSEWVLKRVQRPWSGAPLLHQGVHAPLVPLGAPETPEGPEGAGGHADAGEHGEVARGEKAQPGQFHEER